MGKSIPRLFRSWNSRELHTVARQRRDDIWVPVLKLRQGTQPDNTTAHLIDAGFVRQSNAGVFHFLPLGLRVLEKIERLLDKHMRSIGASKIALSSLSNQNLWRRSGRLDAGRELFKFTDHNKTKWLLAPTHEEEITELIREIGTFTQQSNGFGPRLYQIGRKYRDEIRPRGGLLRGKEFIMKDLYTFDETPEEAHTTYDQIRAAYRRFFDELGVAYTEARADSGSMGGNLSHEFHFPSDQGEDTIATCSKCDHARNVEFVHPIERAIVRLPGGRPDVSNEAEASSMTCRDFISKDKATLIRALVPTMDTAGAEIRDVKSLINTHVIKATLHGNVDVATGIEEKAARNIFYASAEPDEKPKRRRLFYVLDKRLNAQHLVSRLRQDDNSDDLELWAVRSSSQDLSSPGSIDLLLPKSGDPCPSCNGGRLKVQNVVEIGHTFHLGTRYSAKLGLKKSRLIHSSNGKRDKSDFAEMGCHGIGVSRLIAATALPFWGSGINPCWQLRWPKVIAPYQVCVIGNSNDDGEKEVETAHQLYDALEASGERNDKLDVLLDDRAKLGRGWKINEARAMGIPIVVVIRAVVDRVNMQCPALDVDQDVEVVDVPKVVRDLMKRL